MDDLGRERRAERIMNGIVGLAVIVAVAVGVILVATRSGGDEPARAAVDQQAQAAAQESREAAERAEKQKSARERARERRAMLDGRDRANEKRVLWDWQDDVWMNDEVWKVEVKRGKVTIDSKLDPVKGSEFTARRLCEETLERYDWAKGVRVRYRPPSGATAARCGASH